jgi:hypothetical protein
MIKRSFIALFGPLVSATNLWNTYKVAGMDVLSVTDDQDADSYKKVVIMLHGGGMEGEMWR